MNGPHCPKCGSHSAWTEYANGDALQCQAKADALSLYENNTPCLYIHWLRNAPATSPEEHARVMHDEKMRQLKYELQRRQDRVRKLVHSLIRGGYDVYAAGGYETVAVCARMDATIEAIANSQGSDSSILPRTVGCNHRYSANGESSVEENGKCCICGNKVP